MPVNFIRRTRLLPYHGTVKVQEGDWVHATDVVAELDYIPGDLVRVPAARHLDIAPEDLSKHMLRSVGDKIEEGEPLASSMLFGEAKQSVSPTSGYVALVSNSQGMVYVRQPMPLGDDQPVVIDLVKEAKISKLGLVAALRVNPGRIVVPGQVLVMSPGVIPKSVVSPIYGRVQSYRDGIITIVPVRSRNILQAYLTGRVKRVIKQQGVEIEAYAHVITGAYGVGAESGGEILLAAEADEELPVGAATAEWQGKIVVAGRTASLDLLRAAAAVGCAGLVVGHINYDTLVAYMGSHSRPGMTGDDEVLMPVMLTERFDAASISSFVWQELASLQGRYASMSGKTQIRAGLVRPEVVVCLDKWPQKLPACEATSGTVQVGDWVRVLRRPYRDQVGQVVDLPPGRQEIASGARLRVAEVVLDGKVVTVPVANLLKLEVGGRASE